MQLSNNTTWKDSKPSWVMRTFQQRDELVYKLLLEKRGESSLFEAIKMQTMLEIIL